MTGIRRKRRRSSITDQSETTILLTDQSQVKSFVKFRNRADKLIAKAGLNGLNGFKM